MHDSSDKAPPGDPLNRPASRRAFLKGMGIVAGVAILAPGRGEGQRATVTVEPPPARLHEFGSGMQRVVLNVNGEDRPVLVEPRATLLDTLRMQLDLTGAKPACDRGACGACTVLVNGVAVCSCMELAIECEGDEITTVEGIAADPRHEKLIDSFCDHDAGQCGYCIPGLVTRSAEVVAKGGYPNTPEGARDALAGNLCRCGAYPMIFEALAAARGGTT